MAKTKIDKTRFYTPYTKDNKTQYPKTRGKSGVYLISENGKVVYIGYSATNLYRTMYRHFEEWNHQGQEVITYKTKLSSRKYSLRVVLCTPARAMRLERALIIKHRPRDNKNKYTQYTATPADKKLVQDYENEFAQTLEEAPF